MRAEPAHNGAGWVEVGLGVRQGPSLAPLICIYPKACKCALFLNLLDVGLADVLYPGIWADPCRLVAGPVTPGLSRLEPCAGRTRLVVRYSVHRPSYVSRG